jgi:MFS family permease
MSIFWLALSVLLDGVNTLVLPLEISKLTNQETQATTLGLLSMIGLFAGALIQPVAGALSDRWRPVLARKGFIGIGVFLCLLSLFLFAMFQNLIGLIVGYLLIQISASLAQAGQQGLIPDLAKENSRGVAAGLKGFMDLTGAMLGFILLGQLLGADKTSLALGVIAAILLSAYFLGTLLTPEDKPTRATRNQGSISRVRLFRLDFIEQALFKRLLLARFLFLFGIYAIGRFLLFFVSEQLNLDSNQAAEQAGTILAGLAFVTIVASPFTGWLADRIGRVPLMFAGAILGAGGALLLIPAKSLGQILLFGSLMSLGSASFAGGSWALLADLAPKDEAARYFGLANFSTAGSTAAAGLLGPLIDWVEKTFPGNGYSVLFIVSALAFLASLLPIQHDWRMIGVKDGIKGKTRAHASGLAVLSVQAHPASVKKDHQDSPPGTTQL